MFPAGSVCVAVSECVPSCSVEVVIDHVPPATVSVPTAPSRSDDSVTVAPVSPVPVIVGVVSDVRPDGALITGADAVVSKVMPITLAVPLLPTPSSIVMSMV